MTLVYGVILLFGALFIALVYFDFPTSTGLFFLLVAALLGGGLFAYGVYQRPRSRERVKELQELILAGQARLALLERERTTLLASIREGDLNRLSSFGDYVFQELPILLLPNQDDTSFRPQKGETCLVQINEVKLGRLKTRTEMRKTGGGYRIGRVYVPVQKERVQITEMNTLDTGTLAITDRRVLYLGEVRKLSTKLDKILEQRAYEDALAVTKEGRQSADFFLMVDGELLAAIIDGVESQS